MATAAKTSLLKSGLLNWFLDPKIKTFFQNNSFFFQTQVYQNRWPIEALKKQKNAFLFISIYQTFTRSEKLLGKFQEGEWVNFAAVDFLEMVLRKKKIVVAYLFPP